MLLPVPSQVESELSHSPVLMRGIRAGNKDGSVPLRKGLIGDFLLVKLAFSSCQTPGNRTRAALLLQSAFTPPGRLTGIGRTERDLFKSD